MARMVALVVLLAAALTLASPLPSHAGMRVAVVAGFPVRGFPRPAFAAFSRSFVVVNRPFVVLSPFVFPVRRIFVREVIPAPIVVAPVRPAVFVAAPVFVRPVPFGAPRCFVDGFGVLRCFP
jgi:hypothetical protein